MNLLADTFRAAYKTYMSWYEANTILYLDRLEREYRLEK